MAPEKTAPRKATTAAWKKRAVHEGVTLLSGVQVSIKLPNIPRLVEAGQIPNDLIEVAVKVAQGQRTDSEALMKQEAAFTRKLVSLVLVEPQVEESEVDDLPYEDAVMLVEIATRQRDLDALGHHIGGLHTQSDFRSFRALPDGDTGLAGYEGLT